MAKLTEQDKKNYDKLKEAFKKIDPKSESLSLKAAKDKITIDDIPKETEALRERIERIERYIEFSNDFGNLIKFTGDGEDAGKFEQQFSDAIENLQRSLNVIEDEALDLTNEIEELQPDNLFLKFVANKKSKEWTRILIKNRDPNLEEEQIDQLTKSWGTAVSKFVEDARKPKDPTKHQPDGQVEPGQSDTFAHFFRIHKELEILYGRLADTEAVQSSR
jgi:predicted  nucleic acid-binding Zn-ribbon protein